MKNARTRLQAIAIIGLIGLSAFFWFRHAHFYRDSKAALNRAQVTINEQTLEIIALTKRKNDLEKVRDILANAVKSISRRKKALEKIQQ
ncbi:MAG: hypothetical protein RB296_11950 [Acidobacteriota bacterium]|jgi:hypothetical protein|nr:hypothetical protein [Acidobacteriota bacterium]